MKFTIQIYKQKIYRKLLHNTGYYLFFPSEIMISTNRIKYFYQLFLLDKYIYIYNNYQIIYIYRRYIKCAVSVYTQTVIQKYYSLSSSSSISLKHISTPLRPLRLLQPLLPLLYIQKVHYFATLLQQCFNTMQFCTLVYQQSISIQNQQLFISIIITYRTATKQTSSSYKKYINVQYQYIHKQ